MYSNGNLDSCNAVAMRRVEGDCGDDETNNLSNSRSEYFLHY